MSSTQLPLSNLLPAGITCLSYERGEGKRCLHYLPSHSCTLPAVGLCTEWLKRNTGQQHTAEPSSASHPPSAEVSQQSTPSVPPTGDLTRLRGFTTEDIDSFKALGIEIRLQCELVGELWLVPSYTGQGRRELTPEHAATLLHVMSVFPGSRVASFQPSTKPTIARDQESSQ